MKFPVSVGYITKGLPFSFLQNVICRSITVNQFCERTTYISSVYSLLVKEWKKGISKAAKT